MVLASVSTHNQCQIESGLLEKQRKYLEDRGAEPPEGIGINYLHMEEKSVRCALNASAQLQSIIRVKMGRKDTSTTPSHQQFWLPELEKLISERYTHPCT